MKKSIISFCIVAFAAATFASCQKETARPSNSLNTGNVSNIGKTKYSGQTGTEDSTRTKTNP